jgi:predicted aspartyl protease
MREPTRIGYVNRDGEACVQVVVRSQTATLTVDAVLDTGFNGGLALPASKLRALGAREKRPVRMMLADGSVRTVRRYEAHVTLGPVARAADVVEAGEPLVGTRLVWGHDLRVACTAAGRVALAALPAP